MACGRAHSPPPLSQTGHLAKPLLQQQVEGRRPLPLGLIPAIPGQEPGHLECLPWLLRSPVLCKSMHTVTLVLLLQRGRELVREQGPERLSDAPGTPSGAAGRVRTSAVPWGQPTTTPVPEHKTFSKTD